VQLREVSTSGAEGERRSKGEWDGGRGGGRKWGMMNALVVGG